MIKKILCKKEARKYYFTALTIILLISLLSCCTHKTEKEAEERKTLLTAIYEEILYIADPKGNIHTANFYGEVYCEQTSMDGTKYIVIDDDDYTLLYFDGEQIITIANYVGVAVMSADGNSIAYVTADDPEDRDYDLYLYQDNKATLIDSGRIYTCVISPDGSAVGYTTKDEDGTYRSYFWNGSKELNKIGKDKGFIAISNKGEYIYYVKLGKHGSTEGYYVQQGTDGTTKKKLTDRIASKEVYFNIDATEFIFSSEEKTYISLKGKRLIEIGAGECIPLLPKSIQTGSTSYQGPTYTTCGLDSFLNTYYSTAEDQIVYTSPDDGIITVAEFVSKDDCYICRDGQAIFYYVYDENSKGTYWLKNATHNLEPIKVFDEKWIAYSDDEKMLYFQYHEEEWNKELMAYQGVSTLYQADITRSIIKTDKINDCYIEYTNEFEAFVRNNSRSSTIPEEAYICTAFNGNVIYEFDDKFYCIIDGKTQIINGLDDWQKSIETHLADMANIKARDLICTYRNVYIAFGSVEAYNNFISNETDKLNLAGCYFSIDGVTFKPLTESYTDT